MWLAQLNASITKKKLLITVKHELHSPLIAQQQAIWPITASACSTTFAIVLALRWWIAGTMWAIPLWRIVSQGQLM